MDELSGVDELYADIHTNLLRELALNVILLEDKNINNSLFEYLQFIGDFELLGEITRLTMKAKN